MGERGGAASAGSAPNEDNDDILEVVRTDTTLANILPAKGVFRLLAR